MKMILTLILIKRSLCFNYDETNLISGGAGKNIKNYLKIN